MAITAAQLLVKVQADVKSAADDLVGFSKVMAGVGIGAALVAVGVGVAAVKMAGDFQAGMTSLVTGAGESQKNLGLVSDGILKMAVDTGTTTQQLTAGMYMIESAGYHGAAGLDVLKASAEGAKVGNADLGVVADATTTILKDYPGVVGGASGAVNTLIATVAGGKTHMADLAGAMSQILPTASAAHVGLNDVMGAMATMTGEGVPAANAATYLRQTILALDAPSKAAKTALESVGLSSSAVAAEMQKSLPDTLAMITEAVGKKFPVGSAAYVQALKDISGGSKTMQGMLDLTGQHMTDFIANTKGVGDAADKSSQGIAGWSKVQNDFNFKMDRAKEVVETLMIGLGQHLLPVVGNVVDAFSTHLVPTITTVTTDVGRVAQAIGGMIQFLQSTGPAATAVKVVLAILAGAMLGMAASTIPALVTSIIASVTAYGAQTAAAIAATAATIAATAPFIAVGAAIAAVIAIIILAVTHWNDITAAIGNFIGWIGQAPAPLKILAAVLLLPLAPIALIIAAIVLLKQHWGDVTTFMGNALHGVVGIAQSVGGAIGGAIKGGLDIVISVINDFIELLDKIQIHIPSVGVGPVHSPSFDWNGLKIPTIPLLAEGGDVAPGGKAIVGDAGPEYLEVGNTGARVTPLPAGVLGSGVPGLAAGGANGQPLQVVVQLNGQTLVRLLMPEIVAQIRNATGTRSF